jgi:CheY-like chemotaxis protein
MNKNEKKILYIEDDESNFQLIKRLLKNTNFKLIQAEDSLKGLDLVKKQAFDLILLDINMAGLNGYETATRLKMLKPNLPLVALTANKIDRAKERALVSGCDGKVSVVIGVTDDLTGRFNAVDMVRMASEIVGGKGGGGRPDMAQAGGSDTSKMNDVLSVVQNYLKG